MADEHHHFHAHGSPLGFTGERVLPDEPEWAWCFQAHKFGYDDLAARIKPGELVADVGSGEGYGSDLLSKTAGTVIASDVSEEAVRHARAKYTAPNIKWMVADAQRPPFKPGAFDVIASLQVIEHFTDTDSHLAGIAAALKPGGWHYVATPNIDKMGPEEADNEFHLRDFTTAELRTALESHFDEVEVLGMFYIEDSPRVLAMRAAEQVEEEAAPKLKRVESLLAKLPGPLRVRLRGPLRKMAGIPSLDADTARNQILAADFVARGPADESFCLIGIARRPRS